MIHYLGREEESVARTPLLPVVVKPLDYLERPVLRRTVHRVGRATLKWSPQTKSDSKSGDRE